MYFSQSTREITALLSEAYAAAPCKRLLKTEAICAVIPMDETDAGFALDAMKFAGSALSSDGVAAAGKSLGMTVMKRHVVGSVAVHLVTGAWFAIKYPVVGPLVSFFPGFFGPPRWLVGGTALAIHTLLGRVKHVYDRHADRKNQIRLMTAAIPTCWALAEVDGTVSIEETRFIRDLIRTVPPGRDFDPADLFKQVTENAPKQVEAATENLAKLSDSEREAIVRFWLLLAHSDNHYSGEEQARISGFAANAEWDVEELAQTARAIEREYEEELRMAEAVIRAAHQIGMADKEFREETAELIDLLLMSQIPSDEARQQLADTIRADGKHSAMKQEAIVGNWRPSNSIFSRLNPWRSADQEQEMLDVIAEEIALFVESLARIQSNGAVERRMEYHQILKSYGFSDKKRLKLLELTRELLDDIEETEERVNEATESTRCPHCGEVGAFDLVIRNYLQRNRYQCKKCKAETHFCRMWKCTNMVQTGILWHDEFCEEHSI